MSLRKRMTDLADRLYLPHVVVDGALKHANGSQQEAAQFLIQLERALTVGGETPRVRVMQERIADYWIRQVKTIGRASKLDEQQQTLSDCLYLMDGDDLQSIAKVCRFYAPAYIGALSNGPSYVVDQIEVIENLDWRWIAEEVLRQWRQVQARVEARRGRKAQQLKRKACKSLAA